MKRGSKYLHKRFKPIRNFENEFKKKNDGMGDIAQSLVNDSGRTLSR